MTKLVKTMFLCTIYKEINHRNVHCFTPVSVVGDCNCVVLQKVTPPLRYVHTVSVSESVSVSASVSVSVAPFTLNENSCQFSTLSYVHNCLARRQSVILYRDLQDSDGNGRPYQFFTVGGPIETERTLIWWHWIGDWHGNWCSLNTASNLIRKWLLFGHGDWYGHGDGHGDGHSVNVPLGMGIMIVLNGKLCPL